MNSYLLVNEIDEYSFSGLQVSGMAEINKIGFAVDAGVKSFQAAQNADVDMLIVHHGLFWKGADPRLVGVLHKRVSLLMDADISLYAVHLPLDMHEVVGHNSALLRTIGAVEERRFSKGVGALGRLEVSVSPVLVTELLSSALGCSPKVIDAENGRVRSIAVLSGAAGRGDFLEAIRLGADLFITGESCEWYHDANDYGCSVIFLGHHASEMIGLWELEKQVKRQFPDIETQYLDVPTGL